MKQPIDITVNGQRHTLGVDTRQSLLDVLRDEFGLMGTKFGCGYGMCGACTIVLDGKATNACLVLAVQADGSEVTTVEGLAQPDRSMHPLQEAFISEGAFQCGYCTPGFLMSTYALLQRNPNPTDDEIRRALVGNLCRCTGYVRYLSAIKRVIARAEPVR